MFTCKTTGTFLGRNSEAWGDSLTDILAMIVTEIRNNTRILNNDNIRIERNINEHDKNVNNICIYKLLTKKNTMPRYKNDNILSN